MGPVHRAEGVGHVDIRQRGQFFGKCGVVLGLALFKPGVFQQQDLAGLQRGGLGLGILPHNVMGKGDLLAQQLGKTRRHGGQGQLLLGLFPGIPGQTGRVLALFRLLFHPLVKVRFRLAQVGAGDDCRTLFQEIADGGQGRHDPLVAGDLAGLFVLGHVEIAAQQDLLALYVNVTHGLLLIIHKQTPKHIVDLQCF